MSIINYTKFVGYFAAGFTFTYGTILLFPSVYTVAGLTALCTFGIFWSINQ